MPARSRIRRAALTLAAGGLAGLSLALPAATSLCRDGWICVDEVSSGDALELHARNLRAFPLTYTLHLRSREGASDATVTDTLGPLETRRAVLLATEARAGERSQRRDVNWTLRDWTIGDKDADHDDDHVYALPYQAGRTYPVLQGYGSRFSHRGLEQYAVDFDMPEGTPVHAARAGVVARVVETHDRGCWKKGCERYANYIVILHDDGTTGEYYHLARDGAVVDEGDDVVRGQHIGYSGNTGQSAMPHLHFAVYRATAAGRTQSIPVRFRSADGIVGAPRRGARHQATY